MKNKITILFGIFLFILLISIISILSTIFSNKENKTLTKELPIPTLAAIKIVKPDRVAQYREKRKPLSSSENIAKNTIINLGQGALPENSNDGLIKMGERTGKVFMNDEFTVYYVRAADMFMVEISTTNIKQAKEDTIKWFLSQGINQQGICNLPVMFYINWDIRLKLQNINRPLNFNPIPDGC